MCIYAFGKKCLLMFLVWLIGIAVFVALGELENVYHIIATVLIGIPYVVGLTLIREIIIAYWYGESGGGWL